MALRGVTYTWKADPNQRLDYGFIAEEVAQVVPELVSLDATGQHAEGLDYARLLPILVESLKAQQRVIEARERELALLTQRLAQLEQLVEARFTTNTPAQR
jgi:flagellar motility protein MotE (MotC chaperone)